MWNWLVAGMAIGFAGGCGGATTEEKQAAAAGTGGGAGTGGSAATGGTEASSGKGGEGATPDGVGPIDDAAQPAELNLACDGRGALAFKLPCQVGLNLSGDTNTPGYHITQCELRNAPGQAAVTFVLPLVALPQLLNQPVPLPFDSVEPPAGPGATIGSERFVGKLSGVATFTRVDLDGRAFVAELAGGHVDWSGKQGSSFECTTLDGKLWGVAGDFL